MRIPPSKRLISLAALAAVCFLFFRCDYSESEYSMRPREGVLIVGIETSPESLDPRIGTSQAAFRLQQLLYNPLADQNKEGRIVPSLAEGYESNTVEINGKKTWMWEFRLRKGISFHDGKQLTAEDVVYTFHSLCFGEITGGKKAAFDSLISVNATGPYKVVFTLSRPQPWFPATVAAIGIVPKDFPADGSEPPNGTGPFRFLRRDGPNKYILEANERYFRGPPKIRRLVLKVIPEDTTRALELMRGSVDLVINDLTDNTVAFLSKREGMKSISGNGLGYVYLGINHSHPILGHRLVRRAIAHAIDRETIIEHYLAGLARLATSPLIPELWEPDVEFKSYDYDPQTAMRLLDEAGYPDPDGPGPLHRFSLEFKVSSYTRSRDLAVVFKLQLAAVGIQLNIRSLEFQTLRADISAGNFALTNMRWIGIVGPDFGWLFHSTSVPGGRSGDAGRKRGSGNRGRYSNPNVDLLIERAEIEMNTDKRWRIAVELQNELSEDLPYIDLWYSENYAVMREELEGLELTANASFAALAKVYYRQSK